MATKLPEVDVVLIGFGLTASILAQELTEAGLQVLALERGGFRDTVPDFSTTTIQDELRYAVRNGLFEEPERETLTFRNSMDQTALPMRHLGSFLPAAGVGGALERPALAVPAQRFHDPQPLRKALQQEFHPREHDHPGLGRHLRRPGTVLRPLRLSQWGVRTRRQHQRRHPARWQSVRGAA